MKEEPYASDSRADNCERREGRNIRSITRRDFVNGIAIATAAGSALSPMEAMARGLLSPTALGPEYYPPRLTGLRGSHVGSFEVAHAVGREGRRYDVPAPQTDETYDLVVVGGGLSGLAAAWFFREAAGAWSSTTTMTSAAMRNRWSSRWTGAASSRMAAARL